MTLVAPKDQLRDPWQYTGQPRDTWPQWVRACCTFTMSGALLVARRSGEQEIRKGEWLLRNLDARDPEWVTDAEYRRHYVSTNR